MQEPAPLEQVEKHLAVRAAQPARTPDRVVAWGTGAIIAAAALGGAVLIGGSALILWAITMTGVLLLTVSVLLSARQEQRSRRRPLPHAGYDCGGAPGR